jgi:hypothetical protein
MAASLEEVLISVWRQAMVEESKTVTVESGTFPVRRTSRSRLREVDFQFEGHELRGLEQNPETGSRWAQLARQGKKLMQFAQTPLHCSCGRWKSAVLRGGGAGSPT